MQPDAATFQGGLANTMGLSPTFAPQSFWALLMALKLGCLIAVNGCPRALLAPQPPNVAKYLQKSSVTPGHASIQYNTIIIGGRDGWAGIGDPSKVGPYCLYILANININIKLALATKSKYKLPPGGNYNGVPAVHLYDGRRPVREGGRKGLEGLTPTRFRRNRATEPQAREANLIPKESDSLRVTNSGMVFLRLG